MSIYDDIENAIDVPALKVLYQSDFIAFTALKKKVKEDTLAMNAISDQLNIDRAVLDVYGKRSELKDAFYLKLGELLKSELKNG
jgi:hypothetical protein